MKVHKILIIFGIISLISLNGCSVILQKRHPSDQKRIEELERLAREKDRQAQELLQAKRQLERSLRKEIENKTLSLDMAERGLIITFVAEVLFDSGKAEIKTEARKSLDEVAKVLNETVADRDISIEGHTDNVPIKHSGWKSNWELSTARAVSVLHYLVDQKNILPQRVSATGYGEQKPIASNDTKEGKAKNRRVEIVILPKQATRIQKLDEPSDLTGSRPIYKK
ncbi:MAG: OmpA family protein [Candidatus Omnitrophota bacterium]